MGLERRLLCNFHTVKPCIHTSRQLKASDLLFITEPITDISVTIKHNDKAKSLAPVKWATCTQTLGV